MFQRVLSGPLNNLQAMFVVVVVVVVDVQVGNTKTLCVMVLPFWDDKWLSEPMTPPLCRRQECRVSASFGPKIKLGPWRSSHHLPALPSVSTTGQRLMRCLGCCRYASSVSSCTGTAMFLALVDSMPLAGSRSTSAARLDLYRDVLN